MGWVTYIYRATTIKRVIVVLKVDVISVTLNPKGPSKYALVLRPPGTLFSAPSFVKTCQHGSAPFVVF